MFQKLRIQLTAVNALVFFVMLLVGGVALYGYMEHRLFEEIDESLHLTALQTMHQGPARGLEPPVFKRPNMRAVDRRVVVLLWDEAGQVVVQVPEQAVYEEDVETFHKVLPLYHETKTVSLTDRTYRALSLPVTDKLIVSTPNARHKIQTVQFIRNIDSEQQILDRLLMVIILGSILGVGATVGAGLFLAGKALVPIRLAWEKQQQFVADASHELRTPLAVIRTHGEMMFRHPDQTVIEQSGNISVILNESRRMSKLVADLLTLARSDSNQLEIRRGALRVDLLVAELAEQFGQLAEIEEIRLTTDIEPCIEWEADEERIRQLLVILLDNALQYTPEGGQITLICKKAGGVLDIRVTDTGIGIAQEELPHVFDRFYRGDKARNRAQGGTGLGLSIAKWITEAHGGKIRAQSTLGEGTTMSVQFPLTKANKKGR